MNKETIYERIVEILTETFDIEAERITPEARLHDDLDIDSIDAVDLIVQLKPLVGRRLNAEAFKSVRTIQDVVDALHQLMQEDSAVA
ncbi:acyl carrier protein [Delftia sp. WSY_4]|jgi:acyl carrier protein|uniref:Acyl carrier protein n=3 Tax=Pseudomonadota TaxID=1224 RepID=A0AAX3SFV2_9BURK|nr:MULTISPECIES: acyl carrier protein [Delftia]AOV00201.1 acyl carrier protein [Delftia tsuruhatensis]KAF1045852.1 MAG: Acyl carrier protein [Delftia tsuruhatensis]KLO57694.1 acyl carrier protein [Delftia tsuruhatensis]MBD9583254.1 acyl carrier protein [Delftia sp. DLF01]MBJ2140654.1 acyl carrier protein [Delftia acidovorans]